MKKLLFSLLLAAATLPGWADDNFYLLGDATPIGWIGTDETNRQPTKMQPTGNANEYAWTGLLKTADNGFKICKNSGWNGYRASSNGEVLVYDVDIATQDNDDNKWKVTETNYCLVTLNTNTAKIKVHRLVPAKDDGTCLIETESHLTEFRKLVNDKGMTSLNAKLTADITLTGNHTPIGTSTNKYAGTFDGQGHKIENLSISSDQSGVGFFGQTNGATIQKVEFLKAKVTITGNSAQNTGIVVGICDGGTISQCAVVNSYINGRDHTGSIAGSAKGGVTISNCYSNAKVSSTYQAGGFVGTANGDMTLEKCIFMGPRIDATTNTGTAAGLISLIEQGSTTMQYNLVATSHVCSEGTTITYCKSLTRESGGSLSTKQHNYSLKKTQYGKANETYGLDHHDDINGAQKQPSDINETFFSSTLNFDLTNTWKMVTDVTYAGGGSFPILKWMTNPATSAEISSAIELYEFSLFMWDNQNVILTNNIDYSGDDYQGQDAMIGTHANPYGGTFDGQNHTVKVGFNNTSAENTALFCQVNGGTIKNLKVAGNITTDKKFAGGICANVNRKATITNCESNVTITDSRTTDVDGTHGGIVALISSHGDGVEISNCLFSGAITASTADGCGGVVGWTSGGSSNVTIKNCLITGTMTIRTTGANDIIARNGAKESNNYYVGSFTGISNAESATSATDTQKTSGELCYLLNGSTQGGTNWTQTIGTDDYPVPFNTQKLVYFNDPGYANMHIVNNVYQIANANELVDFSALVNSGSTSINAELTADIDMTGITSWTPIGKFEKTSDGDKDDKNDGSKAYNGTFDGKGHTIDNLVQDVTTYNNQGLFGVVNGGCNIKNLILGSGCKFYGGKYVGAFVGSSRGSGWVTIENCGNEANVGSNEHRPSQNAAAFIGVVVGGGPATKILNCYNTGTIKGSSSNDNAILTGWFGGHGSVEVKNFYNIGSVEGYESGKPLYRNGDTGITFTNNYSTTSDQGATQIVDSWKASGELCAKLGYGFRQNLGSDAYPNFASDHGFVAQISEAGYSTMYNIHSDVTIPDGIEAYAGVVNGTSLSLVAIENKIAASEPVVLKLAEGTNAGLFNFMPTTGATPAASNNLSGSDGSATGGTNIYALALKGEPAKVGFYPVGSSVTIPEGKAYLEYTGSNAIKGFTFVFDEDDATGISLMEDGRSQMEDGAIYNLAGQRINKMQRGINIVNGKKILK